LKHQIVKAKTAGRKLTRATCAVWHDRAYTVPPRAALRTGNPSPWATITQLEDFSCKKGDLKGANLRRRSCLGGIVCHCREEATRWGSSRRAIDSRVRLVEMTLEGRGPGVSRRRGCHRRQRSQREDGEYAERRQRGGKFWVLTMFETQKPHFFFFFFKSKKSNLASKTSASIWAVDCRSDGPS